MAVIGDLENSQWSQGSERSTGFKSRESGSRGHGDDESRQPLWGVLLQMGNREMQR